MRIKLHITDRPMESWGMTFPIIPRMGDRILHPHTNKIILRVEGVLLHPEIRGDDNPYDADVYCLETDV
jgi:hypothetical protein